MTREEAIKRINDIRRNYVRYVEIITENENEALDMTIEALRQEPKTGRWVKHDTGHSIYYDCSLCGCVAPYTETADKILWKIANYCPDCGAKMTK